MKAKSNQNHFHKVQQLLKFLYLMPQRSNELDYKWISINNHHHLMQNYVIFDLADFCFQKADRISVEDKCLV